MKKKILLFLLVLFLLLVAAGCGTTDSKVQSTLDAASAKQLEAKRPAEEEPYYEHDVSIGYIYEEENPVTYALTEKEMLEIYDAYLQSREENVWFDGLIDCATICDIVISDHEGSRIFRYIGEYLEEYGQNRCLCLTEAAQSAIDEIVFRYVKKPDIVWEDEYEGTSSTASLSWPYLEMTYGSIEDAVTAIKSAKACGIEEYLEKSGLGKSYAVLYDKDVYYFPKKMPLLPGYQQAGVSIAPSGTAVYYINEDTFDTARLNWTPECDKEERIRTIKSNFYDVERYEGTEFYFGHSGSDIFIHWWEGDNWFELMYPIEAGVPLAVMIENLAFIRYDMAADSREEPHEQMGSLVPCTEDNLSVEYRTALKSAEEYAASTHSSKLGTYNRLTSIYDGSYSLEAAQYAVDHASVDWKEMALARAVDNCNVFPLSKMGLFNTLFSQGGFTEEEAWYAADTIKADWCENALTQAQWYCDCHMSKTGIYNRLLYEAQFTEKETQYAMRNLSVDWSANAVRRASDYECLYLSREAVYRQLTSEYVHFDEVEASNALYHVGVVWEEQALEVAYFLYENTDMTKDEIYERLISGNYLFLPNEAQFAIDNLDFYGCYKAG